MSPILGFPDVSLMLGCIGLGINTQRLCTVFAHNGGTESYPGAFRGDDGAGFFLLPPGSACPPSLMQSYGLPLSLLYYLETSL